MQGDDKVAQEAMHVVNALRLRAFHAHAQVSDEPTSAGRMGLSWFMLMLAPHPQLCPLISQAAGGNGGSSGGWECGIVAFPESMSVKNQVLRGALTEHSTGTVATAPGAGYGR